MRYFKKIRFLLTKKEYRQAIFILFLTFIMSFMDMIGVASILPFITILTNPNLISTNTFLKSFYEVSNSIGIDTQQDFLILLGAIVFFLLIISLSIKALTTYLQVRFTLMREHSIGKKLIENYLHQPYSWFLNRNSSELGKNIISEVSITVNQFFMPMMNLITNFFIILLLLLMLIFVEPILTITIIIFFGALYGIIFLMIKTYLNKIGKKRLAANQSRFMIINESFGSPKEMKLKGLEEKYSELFGEYSKYFANYQSYSQIIARLPRFGIEAVAFGGMLLVMLYLISEKGSFSSALPIITLYAFAAYRLMPAMQQLYTALTQLQYSKSSFNQVYNDFKNTKTFKIKKNNNLSPITFKNRIFLKDISYTYPKSSNQTLKNISTNQTLTINPEDTQVLAKEKTTLNKSLVFKQTENNLGLNFTHEEDNYIDFNRQKLIPYQISDRGPGVAIGDLNNDGKDDVYFGSSKFKTPKVYVQGDSQFNEQIIKTIYKDSITEDVEAIIADFNGDSINDIIIGTGGGDFFNNMPPLLDKYYSQNNKHYLKEDFPAYFENANVIKAFDYDLDGDLDLFIGNNAVSNDFGNIPNSYVLNNDNGYFSILKDQPFQNIGMVTDAIWDDFNSDGFADLIIVGEWMSPKFFRNEKGNFVEELTVNQKLNGLWQQIIPFDIDNDGDTDYLLGNWGENSKFKASKDRPLKMYYSDFDNNETTETIVCNYNKDGYYPILGLDELASQLISLRKKYPSYKNFAGKQISEIIEKSDLDSAKELNVHTLSSGYLKNINNQYTFVPFKSELQIAPITSFLKYDFDDDGTFEILVGGNYFGVTPYHGRFDSFPGALIKNDSTVILGNKIGLNFSNKAIKSLNIISFKQQPFLMVTVNNDKAQVYELTNQ